MKSEKERPKKTHLFHFYLNKINISTFSSRIEKKPEALDKYHQSFISLKDI